MNALLVLGLLAAQADNPPFEYVWGEAHHVLPETHNNESGYFSLSESLDGTIHVGTARYNENAFLVAFDPGSGRQRIEIDVNRVCGLNARGFAAQAKIHTRNYVGPSGAIYVGSKQGYAEKGDTSKYPGGYVIRFDPRTGTASNLGMPYPEQGVADVVADEARGLVYVVTCEDQHWMVLDTSTGKYRELGPMLTPYAMTLLGPDGTVLAITKDFELARWNPDEGKMTVRPIRVDGERFTRASHAAIPTWQLAGDGRTAYLILMNDATLLAIDLETAVGRSLGKVTGGEKPDSRCGLTIGPRGRVWMVVRTQNTTGFGKGMLHRLHRYDPAAGRHETLGVLAVKNKDFFDFGPGPDGKKPPWSHGYHTLPDGTLTPLHHHMSLLATRDGTLYATIIIPFTLLKIEAFREKPEETAASRHLDRLLRAVKELEKNIPQAVREAERAADRYLEGGLMGVPWIGTTLEQELFGRSGGVMHFGFDRGWKKDRTDAEKKHDIAIFGWDGGPRSNDLKRIADYRKNGLRVLGFGSREDPTLKEQVASCDGWFDTRAGGDDRTAKRGGKMNHALNAVNGWMFTAEFVAALTRKGHMPTMWKSWLAPGGKAWSEPLFRKKPFHDDLEIGPVGPGVLSRAYLERIRYHLKRLRHTQLDAIVRAGELIAAESKAGQKTWVASSGHMAMSYIGRYDDSAWAHNLEVHGFSEPQVKGYREKSPEGALVLRLGYYGLHRDVTEIMKAKKQRVILVTADHPDPLYRVPKGFAEVEIDLGYAFGDASVDLPGYPIRILPVSGVMQTALYGAVNAEVFSRLDP